ncbi:MAG TPA: hypothetical protein G4N94_10260 [Caldilineae bacterium]|nr:hypothetical protein [Caldilineae bacterium]
MCRNLPWPTTRHSDLRRRRKPFRGPQAPLLKPQLAALEGFGDGDTAWLSNEQGRVQLTARVTEDVIPGVALAPGIWWNKFSPAGHNVNQLTAQDEADMGAGAVFYDVRVWVRPFVL